MSNGDSTKPQFKFFVRDLRPHFVHVYTVGRRITMAGVNRRVGPFKQCSNTLSGVVHPSLRNRSKDRWGSFPQKSPSVVQSSCNRVPKSESANHRSRTSPWSAMECSEQPTRWRSSSYNQYTFACVYRGSRDPRYTLRPSIDQRSETTSMSVSVISPDTSS